ncbi:MAG TPA: SDR family oxidoreductase [Candidatus Kapabacteria bacterium]|jgi:dTDP-4-dehydrorhamnose reductase|nr:SDR family oxidoreductase [Candidatus Kapabacteria bacterium]
MEADTNIQRKIMIVGARSKVAEAIVRMVRAELNASVILVSSADNLVGDIDGVTLYTVKHHDYKQFKEIAIKELPSVMINCAAMTDVDACEIDKEGAWSSNVTLVDNFLRAGKAVDAHCLHFSTDYIFDGNKGPYGENDIPNPINYYGRTKLASENICHSSGVDCTILRTNIVYGHSTYRHIDFVHWVIGRLDMGKPFKVVDDQFGNPTFVDDIALAVKKVIEKKRIGIYNISGKDYCNRYEFAKNIAKVFSYDSTLINAMTSEELGQKSPRPKRAGLINLKAETDLQMKFCDSIAGVTTLRHQMQMWGK